MLEAEVDRLTGIETEAARKAREEVLREIESIQVIYGTETAMAARYINNYVEESLWHSKQQAASNQQMKKEMKKG
jgi:hypothetical protein